MSNQQQVMDAETTSISSMTSCSPQQRLSSMFKIQTIVCNRLGVSIEINRTHQFGKKFRDEHSEYEIEIKINGGGIDADEQWSIFRR